MDLQRAEVSGGQIATGMAESIYGTLLVMTVVVGVAVSPNPSELRGAVAVMLTAGVFWLAHLYAHWLESRLELRRRSTWPEVRQLAAAEWPLVTSGVPPAAALAVCALLGADVELSFWVALWVGVVALFGWGVRWARREGASWPGVLTAGVVNVCFGLVVVVLKLVVQH